MKKYRALAKESHERKLNAMTDSKGVELGKAMASEPTMKVGGTSEGSHQVMKASGGKPKARLDRYARGGKVKGHGKMTVNVVIAGDKQPQPVPVPVPVGGAPAPALPPHPAALPQMPAGMPAGMPPGPMPRKRGGRVSHPDAPQDRKLIRSMVKPDDLKKRASGGAVGKFTAGAGSGEGRLQKCAHEKRK